MIKNILLILLVTLGIKAIAQLHAGPMLGHVTHTTASVWVANKPNQNSMLYYWPRDRAQLAKPISNITNNNYTFSTQQFEIPGLQPATTYDYQVIPAKPNAPKTKTVTGSFTTLPNWAYRTAVPNVTFITGSCAYINDTATDRVYTDMTKLNKLGTPYGGNLAIFETMANTPANAMLWLGDNWYTREVDYSSAYGLNYRPYKERATPQLQNLLKAMPNYAIWDDHDFGPNDVNKSYIYCNESREAFKRFWANPSYGDGTKGIYTKLTIGDIDFFMLDDRTWRSADNMRDSLNGQPNTNKKMLGDQQIEWLENALLQSNANFKIIVTGSQTLNPVSPYDCWQAFPAEFARFNQFITEEKIRGLLFLTGDRHHTEVIKLPRENTYPLYDITVSPLTSATHKFSGAEKNNPYRVVGVDEKQNFGKATVTGPLNNRKLTIEFIGITGEKLGEFSVLSSELR